MRARRRCGLATFAALALVPLASPTVASARPAMPASAHGCGAGSAVVEKSLVGLVTCRRGGGPVDPAAGPVVRTSSGRPYRLEVTETVGEPGCGHVPDGLRIVEKKVYLDGQQPPFESRGYCWEPGTPRPGSDGIATPPSAEEVVAQAPIPVPVVNINPHVRGLVGIETWLWYDQAAAVTLPPVALDGWSVDADLSVAALAWDMGNGDVVTGTGPGTEDDPSATYVYENECAPCTITMTVTWSGSYTVTHPSAPAPVTFALGAHQVRTELVYDVPEVEAVVIG